MTIVAGGSRGVGSARPAAIEALAVERGLRQLRVDAGLAGAPFRERHGDGGTVDGPAVPDASTTPATARRGGARWTRSDMSSWNTDEWEAMYTGAACPICRQGPAPETVAELEATYLNSGADGPMRGYCWLSAKRHVVEPYELEADEACAFMRDLQRAGKAIRQVTGAVKMNYEIHGNTVPHLHVHLFPRYRGDPFEGGPINPKLIRSSPYREGEFALFVRELQEALERG